MLGHFITFKPTKGVFKQAIRPHQRWYDKSDMSPFIEIEGKYYKILRTTGLINKIKLRKIVICNEEGQLINNKELTRKALDIYVFLANFQFNIRNMKNDSKQNGPKRFGPLTTKLKKLQKELKPVLNEKEEDAINFHLHYYEEVSRLSVDMRLQAIKCINYERELRKLKSNKLSSSFIEELREILYSRILTRSNLEAMLIEDGISARDLVWEVLENPKYKKYIKNEHDSTPILREIIDAGRAAERILDGGKKGWENEKKWVNPNKGPFDLETHINDLRDIKIIEVIRELNINEMMVEHWVFSPDCIYS